MIAGAKILIATSKTEEIIHGLWRLLSPFERLGLPVKDYFHTMGLTLKCFPILKNMLYENYREQIISANIKGIWNRAKGCIDVPPPHVCGKHTKSREILH